MHVVTPPGKGERREKEGVFHPEWRSRVRGREGGVRNCETHWEVLHSRGFYAGATDSERMLF